MKSDAGSIGRLHLAVALFGLSAMLGRLVDPAGRAGGRRLEPPGTWAPWRCWDLSARRWPTPSM